MANRLRFHFFRCVVLYLAINALAIPLSAQSARRIAGHTNHFETHIEEIMVGANGNSHIQFIELSFPSGQNAWGPNGAVSGESRAMLIFYDHNNNETGRFKFPSNPSDPGGDGGRTIVATKAFAQLAPSGFVQADFVIDTQLSGRPPLSPVSGKVCFKQNPLNRVFDRNECVSYGAFPSGSVEVNDIDSGGASFGPPAAAIPITDTISLFQQSGMSNDLNSSFALTTTPTPTSHGGTTFTIPLAPQVQQGSNLFRLETFGGNGRTCATCHVDTLNFGLNPANIQSRFATVGTSFDPLFVGERNFNLNVLVVSNPQSVVVGTSQPAPGGGRDLVGAITGSSGGTAKVLTKLIAPGSSQIRYLVYGGISPSLAGSTVSDAFGTSASFVSITRGNLACNPLKAVGEDCDAGEFELESPRRMRTSLATSEFPQGRGLILENIDGFTNPHSNNHVFRKSPHLQNLARTKNATDGLGFSGNVANLQVFVDDAVKQHFPRGIDRVSGVDFRSPTQAEKEAMEAFQLAQHSPADQNFSLDKFATTAAQKAGRVAFFGTARCSKCHSGDALANTDGSISGKTGNASFNTGVVNQSINVAQDLLPAESNGLREFSTPGLFNVKNNGPFFHDASISSLHKAVEFYTSTAFRDSPAFTQVGAFTMTPQEVDDVTAFLEGLTVRNHAITGGPLSFGSQATSAGATATQQVTITNNSGSSITLTSPFVRLAGTDASQFTITSHTVTGTLANGASGVVDVAFDPSTGGAKAAVLEFLAETPSGVDLSGTGLAPAPTITGISPSSGPTTGGHSATISGTNLDGATVTIGGTAATINGTSSTTVTITTPIHTAGARNVVVTTGGGTATLVDGYTYVAPAIVVSPTSGLTTTEAGGTASFTIVLATKPLSNVTIGVTSNDLSEGTVTPSSVTFTSLDWDLPQTVTVRGADDAVADGSVGYSIVTNAASSSDAAYNGMNPSNVSVTTTDNDVAAISLAPVSGLVTTEGGLTAIFSVRLSSQPLADVTIAISSSDVSEGTVSPASLTFTAANWEATQLVTVTGADDGDADGSIGYSVVTGAASSSDASYNGLNPSDVAATNLDNDATNEALSAGVTIIKAQHILELRQSVNALRTSLGLSAFAFTDSVLRGVHMKGIHVTELRTALDAARQIQGRSTGGYTDPALSPGATLIKAVHLQELRNRL
jgi:hypothetical protein